MKSEYHQLESSNPVLAVLGRSQKSIPKIIRKWFPTLEKHTKIVPGSLPGPAGGPRRRPKPKKAMRTRSRRAPKRHPKQRKCAGSAPRCPKRSAKLEKCGLQRRILTEPVFLTDFLNNSLGFSACLEGQNLDFCWQAQCFEHFWTSVDFLQTSRL